MKELKLPAIIDNLDTMIDFIIDTVSELKIENRVISKLRLMSEEALVNIINYGYPDKTGDILIRSEMTDERKLYVQIIDWGIEFNPLEKEDPDITLPMEERGIGGLGIFMVKSIMDTVEYNYSEGRNILTMTKIL